jgi:phenol 2-monooxygenase (NADPH)
VVRKSLGFKMVGDSSDAIWGVMDIYPRTDFPDIRKKAVLHADAGNLLIIPREGDSLVRFYVELEPTAVKDVTLSALEDKARRILHPWSFEVAETVWWSAYAIGQRLADFFTQDNRAFLTGDACHTHSPKAGQGMNVSLQDGYNIGWKLASILRGQASPAILDTYVSERQQTASDLISFDRFFTKLFSTSYRQAHGITSDEFRNQFVKAGRYTAGQGVKYGHSILVSAATDSSRALATRLEVGMRFPSAQVVRWSDAKAMQLVRAMPADSRWHIVVFGGDILTDKTYKRLSKVCVSPLRATMQCLRPFLDDTNRLFYS